MQKNEKRSTTFLILFSVPALLSHTLCPVSSQKLYGFSLEMEAPKMGRRLLGTKQLQIKACYLNSPVLKHFKVVNVVREGCHASIIVAKIITN